VEFLGTLKVKIVRGISLAVRDLLSSDPYVVATLGAQVYIINVVSHRLHFFGFGIYNFITYFYSCWKTFLNKFWTMSLHRCQV
jgi:hypothetical protein